MTRRDGTGVRAVERGAGRSASHATRRLRAVGRGRTRVGRWRQRADLHRRRRRCAACARTRAARSTQRHAPRADDTGSRRRRACRSALVARWRAAGLREQARRRSAALADRLARLETAQCVAEASRTGLWARVRAERRRALGRGRSHAVPRAASASSVAASRSSSAVAARCRSISHAMAPRSGRRPTTTPTSGLRESDRCAVDGDRAIRPATNRSRNFPPTATRLALVSNRNGTESVLVFDRRDGSVRPLPLDPRFRWVRPSWSARDQVVDLTAYEDQHTRLYRYRLGRRRRRSACRTSGQGAFGGIELEDRLLYMTGNGTGRGTLMQLRQGQTQAEDRWPRNRHRVPRVAARGSSGAARDRFHCTPRHGRRCIPSARSRRRQRRGIRARGRRALFRRRANAVVAAPARWRAAVHRWRTSAERQRPTLAASADGALAVVALVSLGIDLMIARPTREY